MPFLGRTPTQLVDPEVDINGGAIDGVTIGATSASPATVTTFTSTGIDDNSTSTTLTVTDSGIAATLTTAAQPNITSVGTLTGFTSTGIDDNATSTAITIDASENVGIGTSSPLFLLHGYETPGNGAYSDTTNMAATARFHSAEATTGSYTAIQLVQSVCVLIALAH